MKPQSLDIVGASGSLLRVEFQWQVDRYRHVISAVDPAGAIVPLLESIEGSGSQEWPASPPLQSLHLETLVSGRRVALLVGMAGACHWSASIGPNPALEGCLFDIACRTGHAAGPLGSRYRLLQGIVPVLGPASIRLSFADQALRITASVDEFTRTQFRVSEADLLTGTTLIFHPPDALPTGPATRRWQYTLDLI